MIGVKEARGTERTDHMDPDGSDRRPGERVGRGVILIELPLNHLVAQRAGGIADKMEELEKLLRDVKLMKEKILANDQSPRKGYR